MNSIYSRFITRGYLVGQASFAFSGTLLILKGWELLRERPEDINNTSAIDLIVWTFQVPILLPQEWFYAALSIGLLSLSFLLFATALGHERDFAQRKG